MPLGRFGLFGHLGCWSHYSVPVVVKLENETGTCAVARVFRHMWCHLHLGLTTNTTRAHRKVSQTIKSRIPDANTPKRPPMAEWNGTSTRRHVNGPKVSRAKYVPVYFSGEQQCTSSQMYPRAHVKKKMAHAYVPE